jgi:hypothetical protein
VSDGEFSRGLRRDLAGQWRLQYLCSDTPSAITGISFQFTDPCGFNNGYATLPCTPTPFTVDVTVDDLQFTTG